MTMPAPEPPIIGQAGRKLGQKSGAAAGRASVRSALKRVGGAPRPPPETPQSKKEDKTHSSAARAAQAALGMMGRNPAEFDDASLRDWLKQLPPAELQRLSKMVWAAKQDKPQPGFEKIERQLAQHGMQFSINAQNVTVNIGTEGGRSAPYQGSQYSRRRSSYRGDWGRQWARVKDFINGR